jgi:hypothetical protein
MVGMADGTSEAAVNVMVCGVPGTRLSVAGVAVTPLGSPDTETATIPPKEFKELASTEMGTPDPPLMTVADTGAKLKEKSAVEAALCIVRANVTE